MGGGGEGSGYGNTQWVQWDKWKKKCGWIGNYTHMSNVVASNEYT